MWSLSLQREHSFVCLYLDVIYLTYGSDLSKILWCTSSSCLLGSLYLLSCSRKLRTSLLFASKPSSEYPPRLPSPFICWIDPCKVWLIFAQGKWFVIVNIVCLQWALNFTVSIILVQEITRNIMLSCLWSRMILSLCLMLCFLFNNCFWTGSNSHEKSAVLAFHQ